MTIALTVLQPTRAARSAAVQLERASPRLVRVSITDRCDMACVYCRPSMRDGYLPAEDRLSVSDWEALLRGLVREGVRRVRITGGEPLLSRDIVEIVRRVRALGVDDLALTTNASRLQALAGPLRDAGLQRVNISIDSLDPERFRSITRGGELGEVLRGVDAAVRAGFDELKTNTVVLRGVNDDELEGITRWAWSLGMTPRFLEVMGVGEGGRIWRDALVPVAEVRDRLSPLLRQERPLRESDRGPAHYVHARDGRRRVGFISGSSDTFCAGCDRLRATSDGVLRPCLATNDGVDARDALGPDAREGAVRERLREAWALKPDARWKGCTEVSARAVSMRGTGG